MDDKIINGEEKFKLTKKEKVNSLFKYIEELNKIKQKIVLKTSDYSWVRSIKSIPEDDENIKVYYRDRIEEEDNENATNILLSVHKPEFQKCPDPDSIIKEWIEDGWNDFRQKIKAKDYILRPLNHISSETLKSNPTRVDMENQTYKEYFTDSKDRIESFHLWSTKRNTWMEKQLVFLKTRDLFTELYKICIDLERDSEILELVVANGYLMDRDLPELNHP